MNQENERFPDLADLPPELGLAVLSHLNATDLCLAACVWNDLAHDEILWMGCVQYFYKFKSRFDTNQFSIKTVQKPMGLFINLSHIGEPTKIV